MNAPFSQPALGLADLVAPHSMATLIEHLTQRRPLHIPAPEPDRFAHLFSWSRLDEILSRGRAEDERVFMFAGGRQLNPASMGAVDGAGGIDAGVIRALFRQGATFTLPNIQDHFEETRALVADAKRLLGERVEIRVIASPATGTPIPVHFDPPDLLVLQIEGAKRWTFLGEPVKASGFYRTLENRPTNVSGTIHMRRGDVLFLPSGLHHQCLPDGESLHLALSIYRRTGRDFALHIQASLAEDLLFAEPLPTPLADDALREHEARLKQRLIERIARADLRRFLSGEA